jgi:hypothetical protein
MLGRLNRIRRHLNPEKGMLAAGRGVVQENDHNANNIE